MALSGQADSGQNGTDHARIDQFVTTKSCSTYSTGFVPNPAAKPFFPADNNSPPNGMKLKWQKRINPALNSARHKEPGILEPHHGRMNGMEERMNDFELHIGDHGTMSPSLSHSSPNAEDETPPLMIPSSNVDVNGKDGQNKKHIAFHLLSTVLDDEILEDHGQFPLVAQAAEDSNSNPGYERSESWPVSSTSLSSSFTLSLDLNEHCNPPANALGNRSIHEIWSPKPSPRDSYPSTPSEENMPYFPSNTDPFEASAAKSESEQRESPAERAMMASTPHSAPSHGAESPPFPPAFEEFYCKDRAKSLPHSSRPESYKQSRSHSGQSNQHGRYMKRVNSVNGYANERNEYRKTYPYNGIVPGFNAMEGGRPMNGIHKVHYNGNGKEYGDMFRIHAAEKLGCCLDDCLDQLRNLERECRKAEQELSKVYPPRRPSANGASHAPRLPANPTRVDRMIVEQTKEHNKVESLIGRIERLSRSPMHSNVGVALDQWLACIKDLQMTRKDEIANSQTSSGYGTKSYAVKDLLALSHVVQDLIGHTRSARMIVWCAMQMLHVDDEWVQGADGNGNLDRSHEKS